MAVIPRISHSGIVFAVLVGEAVFSQLPVPQAAVFSELTQLGFVPVLSQDSWQ